MFYFCRLPYFLLIGILCNSFVTVKLSHRSRRQVFREEFSPLIGGRVPSSALNWFRLMFNNLDSRGISIPDGFILSNDRTPEEGVRSDERRIKLYSDSKNKYIDSTYTVRSPVPTRHVIPRTMSRYQLSSTDQPKEDELKAGSSITASQRQPPSFIHDIKTIEGYLENPNDEYFSSLPGFINDYKDHHIPGNSGDTSNNIISNLENLASPGHSRPIIKPQNSNEGFQKYPIRQTFPFSSNPKMPFNFHHQPPKLPMKFLEENKHNHSPFLSSKYNNDHYYSPISHSSSSGENQVNYSYYHNFDCQGKKIQANSMDVPFQPVKNEYNLTEEKLISEDSGTVKPEAISPHLTFSSELSYYENFFPDLFKEDGTVEEEKTKEAQRYHAQIQHRNNLTTAPPASSKNNKDSPDFDFNDHHHHSVDLSTKKETDVQETSLSSPSQSSSFPLLLDENNDKAGSSINVETGEKDFYVSTPIVSEISEMDSYDKFKSALIDEIIARLKASAYDSTTHHIVTILPPMKLLGKNTKNLARKSRSRSYRSRNKESSDDLTKLQLIIRKLIKIL